MSTIETQAELSESKQEELYLILTIPAAIVVICVVCRFIARKISNANFWYDDWVMLGTFVVWIGCFSSEETGNVFGAGRHFLALSSENQTRLGQLTYANETLWPVLVAAVKCSILCLYLRLFGVNRTFARLCYLVIALSLAWMVGSTFAFAFQCIPARALWEPQLKTSGQATCLNLTALFLSTGILHIFLDLAILLLPLGTIWKLNLSRGRKIALSALFMLGTLTTALSIVRLYYIAVLPTTDFTWSYVPVFIWTPLEIDVAIICACLPVMAPLFRLLVKTRLGLLPLFLGSRQTKKEYHERMEDDTSGLVNIQGDIQLESIHVK